MMDESNEDKRIEHARYNERAKNLNPSIFHETETRGAKAVPLYFRSPYTYYEEQIRCHINAQSLVLEIGSGIGMHTGALLEFGGHVMATDISEYSLEVLQTRYSGYERLLTKVADMESLPFQDESFDVVTSAGSLSYGDNDIVLSEIYRVLKRGGILIAVDSLNNSPVYRFNRWLHYLRGNRSKSTLARMPNIGS